MLRYLGMFGPASVTKLGTRVTKIPMTIKKFINNEATKHTPKASEERIIIDGESFRLGSVELQRKEQELNMSLDHHRLLEEARLGRIARGEEAEYEKYWRDRWRKNPGY